MIGLQFSHLFCESKIFNHKSAARLQFYYLCIMIYIYRIWFFLIALPILLVLTILTATVTVIGCSLGGGRFWGYWPAAIWGKCFCWLSLVRVSVRGKQNIDRHTSYIFVANHQGAYDIFSIYSSLPHPFRWMMKASLRSIPVVGYACHISRQIYVDNSSPATLKHTMERAQSVLRNGTSLVIFPEGARSWDGSMRRFKRGAFSLAQEFNMPVVPVTIDGSFSILPRFRRIPRPGHITITIHKPIPAPESPRQIIAVADEAAKAIASAL